MSKATALNLKEGKLTNPRQGNKEMIQLRKVIIVS